MPRAPSAFSRNKCLRATARQRMPICSSSTHRERQRVHQALRDGARRAVREQVAEDGEGRAAHPPERCCQTPASQVLRRALPQPLTPAQPAISTRHPRVQQQPTGSHPRRTERQRGGGGGAVAWKAGHGRGVAHLWPGVSATRGRSVDRAAGSRAARAAGLPHGGAGFAPMGLRAVRSTSRTFQQL